MKPEEKLAAAYLRHLGYVDVVHEPDGNVTPDFLVDGRIAVEVRRLNQNFHSKRGYEGLEIAEMSLKKINKIGSGITDLDDIVALKEIIDLPSDWGKFILLDPYNYRRSFEI
jgi:hypothetical protein